MTVPEFGERQVQVTVTLLPALRLGVLRKSDCHLHNQTSKQVQEEPSMKIPSDAKHKLLSIITIWFILFLSACSSTPVSTVTSMPDVTFTYISSPTRMPIPTATATLQPSATPFPTATSTPLVDGLGNVIFSESFDDLNFPFNVYGPEQVEHGILILEREKGYQSPPDMWPTDGLYATAPVAPGVTSIILFKAVGAIDYNIGYHTGNYGADSLRRFNYNSSGYWDQYVGISATTVKEWKARSLPRDTWCYFAITRSANGDFDARLWEAGKPETMFKFQGNLGPEWGKFPFTFFLDSRGGTFLVDEYQTLKSANE